MEVAGTAVGIASLGLQLCQGLLKYYASWKDYKVDINNTYCCIENFEQTLLLLHRAATKSNPPQDILKQVVNCIIACESGIERLKKKFEKIQDKTPNSSTLENLRQRLQFQSHRLLYPFQESTLAKLREIISELQGNLLTAIAALNIDIASSSSEKLDALERQTASLASTSLVIRTTVDYSLQQTNRLVQAQGDLDYERACKWLNAPNPFVEYSKGIKEHHPETGTWFLDSEIFENWKSNPGSTIWLHGKPGCGKTVLSSVVIRRLEAQTSLPPNSALAYFFFNSSDGTKTKRHNLIRSFILQLSVQHPDGRAALSEFFRINRNTREDLTYVALTGFLQKLFSFDHIYMVVDALDECAEIREVIEFIHDISRFYSSQAHILLTSRNEDWFQDSQIKLASSNVDLENESVNADLRNFIQQTVTEDEELGSWPSDIQEEIAKSLIAGADCMFRWVALQLDELRKCYTLDGLRKTLVSLPQGLEMTYVRILSNIPPTNRPVVLKLLYWIVFAEMPLDLAAAAETVKLDINDGIFYSDERRLRSPRILLRLCPSLITLIQRVSPTDAECVTLSHASVKEFLLSACKQNDATNFFHVSPTEGPLYVAESCVAYLLHVSKHIEGACTDGWYWQKFKRYPLLEYARLFWDTHIRKIQTRETERLRMLVLEYMDSRLICEISTEFSLDNPYPSQLPPLSRAAELGFCSIIQSLLSSGHEASCTTPDGWTPLAVAVAAERPDVIDILLKHDASPRSNAEVDSSLDICGLAIKMAMGIERSSNMELCGAIARKLLAQGAALTARSVEEIWQHTLEEGDKTAVENILNMGFDPKSMPGPYVSPLHCAIHTYVIQYEGMVQLQRDDNIITAALRENLGKIQVLLNHGAGTEAIDEDLRTPLLYALMLATTRLKHASKQFIIEVCEVLIDMGANIHARDKEKWLPLHWAAAYMDVEVVHTLLQRNAWVEEVSIAQLLPQTPLHAAIISANDVAVVQALLLYGVPIDARDIHGWTALQYAMQACDERPELVELLVNFGASLDDPDDVFETS